jgi:hypothetical protein
MKIPVRFLFGFTLLLYKILSLLLVYLVVFIWDFSFERIKESYKEDIEAFWIKHIFHIELYRYDTLMDFVYDRKNYKKAEL